MGLVLLLILGWCVAVCIATISTAHMLTHPPRRTYASAVARGQPGDPGELTRPRRFSEFSINSRGRTLTAWDIEGEQPGGPTILLLHGWGDSKIGALARIPSLVPHASRLLALDLPGHGASSGTCALGGLEPLDVHELLRKMPSGASVVLYGWSLGAGIALAAAATLPAPLTAAISLRGVIAESPYRVPLTPASNVMRLRGLPWRFNLRLALACIGIRYGQGIRWSEFDRAILADRLPPRVEVLVLHGELDPICPIEDGLAIANAARGRFVQVPQGTHHNLWSDPACAALCQSAIEEFIRSRLALNTEQPPFVNQP